MWNGLQNGGLDPILGVYCSERALKWRFRSCIWWVLPRKGSKIANWIPYLVATVRDGIQNGKLDPVLGGHCPEWAPKRRIRSHFRRILPGTGTKMAI